VVPSSEWAVFVVTGGDRSGWLNGLLTCDLVTRSPGDAVYGLAVAQKGRIVTDVVVVIEPERAVLLAEQAAATMLAESLERHLMMEDAEVARLDADVDVHFAHGPRAEGVLQAARTALGAGGMLDRTGLGGAIMIAHGDARAAVRAGIEAAVTKSGGVIGNESGWDALRLERGVPRFGADFDGTTYPQEASLEKVAVSFSKGCYLGQEVVCMLEMRGHVKRRLVSLVIEGSAVPPRGAVVRTPDRVEVGGVTSATRSPTLGKPVALAMVKFAASDAGTELWVDEQAARVVERPA
jgi:folate-binding protein YgfZ